MLHVMFTLSLEPYNISLLTFASIKQDRSIEYWDHKLRRTVELKLSTSLYNELVFLKNWKILKGNLIKNEERKSMEGVYVVGDSIFSTKPTGIFNRFNRKFSELLKDFNITPRDMIVLSKYIKRANDAEFHQ